MSLTILVGKSGSGKDTMKELMLEMGFRPLLSETTRPMREGEQEGREYHFITPGQFRMDMNNGRLIEWRSYKTYVGGKEDTWYYGTPKTDVSDGSYIAIKDIEGAQLLRDYYESCGVPVFIAGMQVDDAVREERAKARGSFDQTEWDRRKQTDDAKFQNMEEICNVVFDTTDTTREQMDLVAADLFLAITGFEEDREGGRELREMD